MHKLCTNYALYALIMQILSRNYALYAKITQKLRKQKFAKITHTCVNCIICIIMHHQAHFADVHIIRVAG